MKLFIKLMREKFINIDKKKTFLFDRYIDVTLHAILLFIVFQL